EGELFYVPATPLAGTQPLYRLYNPLLDEHRDSLSSTGEAGGFKAEGILAFPYKSPVTGAQPIGRAADGSATLIMPPDGSPPPAPLPGSSTGSSTLGSETGTLLGYGFPRHRNACSQRLVVQGAEVKLVANPVAGGAVTELWWNGKQFINNYDYGRQIQAALNL